MTIEHCSRAFPDVPLPILIKTEVLRRGIHFSPEALVALKEVDSPSKGFLIFSRDHGTFTSSRERIPHDFILEDGTLVDVRVNGASPYYIHHRENDFYFADESGPLGKVGFPPSPPWLRNHLEDGTVYQAIAVPIGADKVFCTLYHYCEYWKSGQQCLFCDISSFLQVKKRREKGVITRPRPEQVAEVLGTAFQQAGYRHLAISGGTVLTRVRGKDEVGFFSDYLDAMREAFGGLWWSAYLQIGARPVEELKRLKETGIPALQMNMEVWDRNLFKIICPGKEQVVGWEEWQKRMFEAVDLFGWGRIYSNFVAGVEMAQPFGFKTAREAVKSTLKGFEHLMSHGVLPRKDYWAQAEGSTLRDQDPPPLEYFIELEQGYLDLRLKYDFPFPFVSYCRGCTAIDVVADWDYYFVKLPELKRRQDRETLPTTRRAG
ncbi:MAG: hypothetical protein HY673_10775 [Chloroflexi bacterium]|nr:hypothetical protein [Chloroflexota bacterium]